MTHLCVAIFVTDLEQARRDIALAGEAGADFVELRIDRVADLDSLAELVRQSDLSTIVTRRPTWEGGQSEEPDSTRLDALFRAAGDDATYVDVELKSADKVPALHTPEPRMVRPGIILSTHDFAGRPARLYNLVAELNALGGDVNKIVWMARSIRDNLEAFELLQTRQRPTIALCMGEAGLISRILARKFGAFLTFAALDASGGTAAGQVPVADMKKLYRWDAIGPKTRVYGVVGSPIMHSMSPAIHNASFDAVGYDGVYLPLLVEAGYESFKAFMEMFLNFEGLDLSGLSVTIPHKENALRYLLEKGADVEPLAQSIGAVNTIIVSRPAPHSIALRGINTDYAAILDSITSALGIGRENLAGRRVAVLGAGGTGRTAVAGLAHYGAKVTVYNRTLERAAALAGEFDGRSGRVAAAPMENLAEASFEILINTTSVGMYPKVEQSPLGENPPRMTEQTLVFDTIYNPMETRLLAHARQRGAKLVGGVEMFVRQAAGQFEAWTGQPAPKQVMRQVVEGRLSAR